MKKPFLGSILPYVAASCLALLGLGFTARDARASTETGSITVCKIIIDASSNITNGSGLPATTLAVSGINPAQNSGPAPVGTIGTATFNTPLTFNTTTLSASASPDSQCTTFGELALGDYYYGEETINPSSGWKAPKYNDQFTTPVSTLADFFAYDNKWFDGDPSNDSLRNTNADGHIVLKPDRPDRTLVVLNQREATPTPGNPTGGETPSSPQPFSCPSDTGLKKVDGIFFSNVGDGHATVHWSNKGDASGFHIAYGLAPNQWLWGVEVGNVDHFDLNDLPTGSDIWVSVIPLDGHKCSGPGSDSVKISGVGGQVLGARTPSVLAATGQDYGSILLLGIGTATLSIGLWRARKLAENSPRKK